MSECMEIAPRILGGGMEESHSSLLNILSIEFCILVYFYRLCIANGVNAGPKSTCFRNSDLHCQVAFIEIIFMYINAFGVLRSPSNSNGALRQHSLSHLA